MYGRREMIIEQINNSTGAVQYLHHDQQGSTRLLTGSTGKVEGKCSYSAYGTPTCEGTATTPLGWDGQYTSPDTGLIYMRARTYDPATAQFLSRDPLQAITREPYNYAGDSPVNAFDPSGLFCLSLSWHCVKEDAGEAVSAVPRLGSTLIEGSLPGQVLKLTTEITGTTLGLCASVSAGIGVTGHLSGCYYSTPHGKSCLSATAGSGYGFSLGVSASPSISNAQSCSEIGGPFKYAGAGFDFFAPSGAVGENGCGKPVTVTNPGVGFGLPGGELGASETEVFESL
jgi:RHS repeat-associated protein